MTRIDVAVIGGGLFGRTIAAEMWAQGRECQVLDDARPWRGSAPAACLMRPSWFSKMERGEYVASMDRLDRLFGVKKVRFETPAGPADLDWVDPAVVMRPDACVIPATVTDIWRGEGYWALSVNTGQPVHARSVVVATGVWVPELVRTPHNITALGGWAVTWAWPYERQQGPSRLEPWAPYKQLIGFQRGAWEWWAGDGTALLPGSLTPERRDASENRLLAFGKRLGLAGVASITGGLRPKVPGLRAPALVEEVAPGLWIATGGAKNGTLGAAWASLQLKDRL